jgi:DNA-binding winged helix-turn-helix (wHTH) protein
MSEADLERELARATGEDVRTIRRRGFQLVTPLAVFDPEPDNLESQVYDWDHQEARPLRLVA